MNAVLAAFGAYGRIAMLLDATGAFALHPERNRRG
jgi:hypothetical protein